MTFIIEGRTPTGIEVPRLTLRTGEIIGLSGPSGSGKSRLMRALADLDRSEMSLSLDGTPSHGMPVCAWRRRVLYCAATPAWWDDETIGGVFADAKPELDELGVPTEPATRHLADLSTGEQQRAHVLRHLRLARDVLLLDEPTSALDETAVRAVEALIQTARDRLAILIATHDRAQLARLASRHWVIDNRTLRE